VETALVPLPTITRRLSTVPEDWPSWSLEELTTWARRSLRASPASSAVGVLFLSEKDGSAVLQLVRESISARASDADSADLRLVHGRPKFAELMDGALHPRAEHSLRISLGYCFPLPTLALTYASLPLAAPLSPPPQCSAPDPRALLRSLRATRQRRPSSKQRRRLLSLRPRPQPPPLLLQLLKVRPPRQPARTLL
jgi:hypothetical protein